MSTDKGDVLSSVDCSACSSEARDRWVHSVQGTGYGVDARKESYGAARSYRVVVPRGSFMLAETYRALEPCRAERNI